MFAEIENGVEDVKEDLSHQPELPPQAFRVRGFSLSGPSFPPLSSIYTISRATSNTVTNVNVTGGLHHDDAPAIQEPPKPTQHTAKLNPLAPKFHVADVQPNIQFCDVLQK